MTLDEYTHDYEEFSTRRVVAHRNRHDRPRRLAADALSA